MTQYFEKYVAPIIGNEAAEQIDKFCDIAMGKNVTKQHLESLMLSLER